ncbi:type II secretion system F family protein [Virgibacillus sp. DJP39]|uniref:type II secretion system F family protein n=1 Tax=Virgibacillus sp. DJP39 TaxID=3409790 RepID=UPI003BB6664D
MLYITYLLTILLLIYGVVSLRREKKHKIKSRISSVLRTNAQKDVLPSNQLKKLTFSKRMLEPFWKQLKQVFKKNLSSAKKEKIENKLLQAGNPMGMTPVEFRIVQLLLLVVLPAVFGLYGYILDISDGVTLLAACFGLLIASFFPFYYLKQKTKARGKKALKELPDFLDLLTVSIEAGLGFDSALSKVVAKKDGVLSKEFQQSLEEMRLGKTRRQALSGVRERVVIDDVKSLIGSIIQAEQLGIGMVQILSVQSVEIREKRKQRAEEQAMKAPIKMLFPLVLFIFPCIFIVLLGPAVIGFLGAF